MNGPQRLTVTPMNTTRLCCPLLFIVMSLPVVGMFLGCEARDNLTVKLLVVEGPRTPTQPSNTPSDYCSRAAGTTTELEGGRYSVRVTFMRRSGAATALLREGYLQRGYDLVCDRVLAAGEGADLQVPVEAGSALAVRVEAFDPKTGALALAGHAESLDLEQDTITVYLRRAGELSCVDPVSTPRAFHSATLLPSGKVLLLGGLVAQASGAGTKLQTDTEKAFATGAAELYDPDTLGFVQASGTIPPRAFHRAHLLPSPAGGPYRVLVVGGVTPAQAGGAAFDLRVSNPAYPFLVTPASDATAAPCGLVTVTPATAAGSAPQVSYRALSELSAVKTMFPATYALPGEGRVLVVGGGSSFLATSTSTTDKGFSAAGGHVITVSGEAFSVTSFALSATRVGHAVVPLGKQQVLVVGGTMGWTCPLTAASCDQTVADLVTLGGASATSAPVSFGTAGSPPRTVAWHTLTPLGVTDEALLPVGTSASPAEVSAALLVGGFPLGRETSRLRTDDQTPLAQEALQVVRPGTPPSFTVGSTGGTGALQGSGYHEALRLADGRVLVVGGNVNSNRISAAEAKALCDDRRTPFCGFGQVVTYALETGTATLKASASLRVGRFGHRVTRLLDHSVLVTGGITHATGTPELTAHAEVYDPRLGTTAEDPFGRKPANDYDNSKSSTGHRCGLQE